MTAVNPSESGWSSERRDLRAMDEGQAGNPFKMGGDEIFSMPTDTLSYFAQMA
jgi:hypothetical protein